jgi:hypothetical protein
VVTASEEEQANPSSDWSTDDGQARAIFQWVGGMLYVEHVGWFLWDGRRWQQVGDVRIRHVVQAYYKSRFDHMVRKYMHDHGQEVERPGRRVQEVHGVVAPGRHPQGHGVGGPGAGSTSWTATPSC